MGHIDAAVKLVEGVVKLLNAGLNCFQIPRKRFLRNGPRICDNSKLLRQPSVAKRIRRTCQLFQFYQYVRRSVWALVLRRSTPFADRSDRLATSLGCL